MGNKCFSCFRSGGDYGAEYYVVTRYTEWTLYDLTNHLESFYRQDVTVSEIPSGVNKCFKINFSQDRAVNEGKLLDAVEDSRRIGKPYNFISMNVLGDERVVPVIAPHDSSAGAVMPTVLGASSQAMAHIRPDNWKGDGKALFSEYLGTNAASSVIVEISPGNIINEAVGAIVCPADIKLNHGGGTAKAIADAAGKELVKECQDLLKSLKKKQLEIGDAVITKAGKMRPGIRHVIHAVGPNIKSFGGDSKRIYQILRDTFHHAMQCANDLPVDSISIPALGCDNVYKGINGLDKKLVANEAFTAVENFVQYGIPPIQLRLIRFVTIDDETTNTFLNIFKQKYQNSAFALENASRAVELRSNIEECPICKLVITSPRRLICGHIFCIYCIDKAFNQYGQTCPTCGCRHEIRQGNQPEGRMNISVDNAIRLSGYEHYGTIVIEYIIPDGIQGIEHPNPGQPYKGIQKTAYLPNDLVGQKVCELLRKAFDHKLIFTVGRSIVTGEDNAVIWSDIQHKTYLHSGRFGYPDPTYLSRVRDKLASKGITDE